MLKTSRFALGLLLPLTLAACSTSNTPSTTPAAFYGDGLDHSWTATAQEGQQLYSALSNGLKTQGVDLGVTLDVTASNGWGPIEINTSNGETAAGDGKTLTMKGKTYATGLGVHGDSEIHIKATGLVTPACTHFKADIGIDDEVGANGKYSSVVFQVFADGEKLYDSGLVTGSTPTKSIDIPVGGKSDLRFVVTHGPDLNYYDHADWAGATLSCTTTTPSGPSGSTDTTFGVSGKVSLAGLGSPLMVQPDSSIILVQHTDTITVLRRLLSTGQLDLTYGEAGQILLPASRAVTLYPDGRIVLAQQTYTNPAPGTYVFSDLQVSRYLANGSIDPSFGTNGTARVPDSSGTGTLSPQDVLVDSNGAVIVRLRDGLLRFTPTGERDQTFGVNGFLTALRGVSGRDSGYAEDVVALPDGRYGLLSTQNPHDPSSNLPPNYQSYGLMEILENTGQVITSTSVPPTRNTQGLGMVSWPDGSVAANFYSLAGQFPVKRLTQNGQVTTYPDLITTSSISIAAYGADKLVESSSSYDFGQFGVKSLNADGTLNTAFAMDGTLKTTSVERFLVQPNGGLLLIRESNGLNEIERIYQ